MATKTKTSRQKPGTDKKIVLTDHGESLVIKKAEDVFREMGEFASVISKRAYELFEGRGREPGREIDDWLSAESELLSKPDIEVTESGGNVVINAKVKDFSKKDLKVSLEPNRVAICGAKSHRPSKKRGSVTGHESYSELLSQVIDLPVAVKTEKARARLTDGILHIEAAKA